jgi:hypothetical protein
MDNTITLLISSFGLIISVISLWIASASRRTSYGTIFFNKQIEVAIELVNLLHDTVYAYIDVVNAVQNGLSEGAVKELEVRATQTSQAWSALYLKHSWLIPKDLGQEFSKLVLGLSNKDYAHVDVSQVVKALNGIPDRVFFALGGWPLMQDSHQNIGIKPFKPLSIEQARKHFRISKKQAAKNLASWENPPIKPSK